MGSLEALTEAATQEWLEEWVAGPSEQTSLLFPGTAAPDFELLDDTGSTVHLSDFWQDGPALVMFWRHYGCGCGIDRAKGLTVEADAYAQAGLNPVIVGQGEPERSAQYKDRHNISYPILSDPNQDVYRAYGVGHFAFEQIFNGEGATDYFSHSRELGEQLLNSGRPPERTLVDSPWRASAEFVIGQGGTIRLSYAYQWCGSDPLPDILITAAEVSAL
jgi:peroxiredoxin